MTKTHGPREFRGSTGAAATLLVAVGLVAANLRVTITGVGPLLDQIGDDIDAQAWLLGLLAALPVATWAVISPAAHGFVARWGIGRVISIALAVLLVGTVCRSLPGPTASLWVGTVLTGAAIGVANVVMPAAVKSLFPRRVPAAMAMFTSVLGGFGALGSGIAVPLSQADVAGATLGWRGALLATAALVPFAAVGWMVITRGAFTSGGGRRGRRGTGIWRDRLAWCVAGYMGVQSASFYIVVTWLASISRSHGRSDVTAGADVMVFQLIGIPGSLLIPVLLRGRLKRWLPAAIPALGLTGTAGLLLAPQPITAWILLLGLSAGASLGMALTVIAERAADADSAAALSGMSQAVGYAVAALGPVAFGAVHDATGGWQAPLMLLLVVFIAQAILGAAVGRDRLVLAPASGHDSAKTGTDG